MRNKTHACNRVAKDIIKWCEENDTMVIQWARKYAPSDKSITCIYSFLKSKHPTVTVCNRYERGLAMSRAAGSHFRGIAEMTGADIAEFAPVDAVMANVTIPQEEKHEVCLEFSGTGKITIIGDAVCTFDPTGRNLSIRHRKESK